MKKKTIGLIATGLVLTLAVSGLVGCGTKKTETDVKIEETTLVEAVEETETEVETIVEETEEISETSVDDILVGGYTTTESPVATFDEDIQTVFDTAMGQWNGINAKPVAFLGTQVVAGTNYAFLAESTVDDKTTYMIAIAYVDLEGNTELLKVTDLDITGDNFGEATDMNLEGGWEMTANTSAVPNEEDLRPLNNAEMINNITLTGLAQLGTQVVAGTNHCYFCKGADMSSGEPVAGYYIAYVYEKLDGTSEITDVKNFNIGFFNN